MTSELRANSPEHTPPPSVPQTMPDGTLVTTPVREPAWRTVRRGALALGGLLLAVPAHWRATTMSAGCSTMTFVVTAVIGAGRSSSGVPSGV